MQERIEQDLKVALLAGDKQKTETLRGLKNAIAYEMVNLNLRDKGLADEQIQKVLIRESKKRSEAQQIYKKVGAVDRAEAEAAEKAIIDNYLPAMASEQDVAKAVAEEIAKLSHPELSDMGKIIGSVRSKLGASADGSLIARLVKEAIDK